MAVTKFQKVKGKLEVISRIMNCICPQCGGRMGGHGNEFKCQGECQTDWHSIWE
jgi:tRNA(Ile2) C34 agmatinyltransferase TiaS